MTTVLVADDDQELLEMYDLWLSSVQGVTARTATDGDEALERLDESIDIAVLDRRMPETSGDEVAETIAATFPDCTVVIASAFQSDGNIDEQTYDRYLTKPVGRDELLETIDATASTSLQMST